MNQETHNYTVDNDSTNASIEHSQGISENLILPNSEQSNKSLKKIYVILGSVIGFVLLLLICILSISFSLGRGNPISALVSGIPIERMPLLSSFAQPPEITLYNAFSSNAKQVEKNSETNISLEMNAKNIIDEGKVEITTKSHPKEMLTELGMKLDLKSSSFFGFNYEGIAFDAIADLKNYKLYFKPNDNLKNLLELSIESIINTSPTEKIKNSFTELFENSDGKYLYIDGKNIKGFDLNKWTKDTVGTDALKQTDPEVSKKTQELIFKYLKNTDLDKEVISLSKSLEVKYKDRETMNSKNMVVIEVSTNLNKLTNSFETFVYNSIAKIRTHKSQTIQFSCELQQLLDTENSEFNMEKCKNEQSEAFDEFYKSYDRDPNSLKVALAELRNQASMDLAIKFYIDPYDGLIQGVKLSTNLDLSDQAKLGLKLDGTQTDKGVIQIPTDIYNINDLLNELQDYEIEQRTKELDKLVILSKTCNIPREKVTNVSVLNNSESVSLTFDKDAEIVEFVRNCRENAVSDGYKNDPSNLDEDDKNLYMTNSTKRITIFTYGKSVTVSYSNYDFGDYF